MAEVVGVSAISTVSEDVDKDKITDSDNEAISRVHHTVLRNALSSFLQDGQFCDVILVTKHKRFPCHRVILSAFSSFFKSMFTIGMKEKEQKEINLHIFEESQIKKMLNFIYHGNVLNVSDTFELLPLAVYFQIESLQMICEETLSKAISLDNVCSLWRTSEEDFPQLTKLRNTCQSYVLENFYNFTKTQDFLDLRCQDLIFIISHPKLKVKTEEFVCMAVSNWFQHKVTERKEFLYEVFCHVHFPLIRRQFIEESFPFYKETALQGLMDEARVFSENPGIQADFDSVRCTLRPCDNRERVMVVLGYFENYSQSEEFWCYHYSDKTWQLLNSPEQPTTGYQTCTYRQTCLLLTAGNKFLQFDGMRNSWTTLPYLNEVRKHHSMAVVGENVYVLGGYIEEGWRDDSNTGTTNSVLMFNFSSPEGDWVECGALCFPVAKAAVAVAKENIYLFSGVCNEDVCNFVQCFDTTTNQCTVIDAIGQIEQSFNGLFAHGYGDNIYLTNARKVWRFYGESGHKDGRYLKQVHIFEREGCLAGFVSQAQSLYFLGIMVKDSDSENSVLTKGVAELKLSTMKETTLVDKALFLPMNCRCHNLVIDRNIIDNDRRSFLW